MSGARLGCPLLTARLPCGTGEIRYRCFLPDLTEFAAPSCTGPNYQQSTSHLKNNIRLETLPFTDTVWCESLALYAAGGEGGIRTPGTLLEYTRFPVVHLQPLGHLSRVSFQELALRWPALTTVNVSKMSPLPIVLRHSPRFITVGTELPDSVVWIRTKKGFAVPCRCLFSSSRNRQ
jgi:hypothetical protein